MNININLQDTYPLVTIAKDQTKFVFISPVLKGKAAVITVKIVEGCNAYLNNYHNLSFGPEKDGIIDDFAIIPHVDPSKVFSTVLSCALMFLKRYPNKFLVLDGADFVRAYLYFRTLQRNYGYLHQYFGIRGVKYFVRQLRGQDKFDSPNFDFEEVICKDYPIDNKPLIEHKSLFNVIVIRLRHYYF